MTKNYDDAASMGKNADRTIIADLRQHSHIVVCK